MPIGEFLRNRAFYVVDRFKGGLIQKHIKELQLAFSNIDQGQQLAKRRLDQILKHATQTAPFYRQFSGYSKLTDFPVIQKKTIKENYDGFLSRAYRSDQLFKMTTSGSYGTPMAFMLSKEKRARQHAEIIFFNGWANYQVGMKHGRFRVASKGWLALYKENGVLINPSVIDDAWLVKNRNLLKVQKVSFLLAYPSALHPLAEYCRDQGDGPEDFYLEGIVSGAEPLLGPVRKTFEDVFGCVVLDRYSSNEMGMLAHECPTHKGHHINYTGQHIEILKLDCDEPVEPGELGRVVVTDFFSHAMPLIRYDIGDTACWAKEKCLCGLDVPVFEKIGGRVAEAIYDPSGKIIFALTIAFLFADVEWVSQYQFIQTKHDSYLVKLRVTDQFIGEDLLRQRLIMLLGPKANILFEYVDSIPPLASGKRPLVVNEYKR